MQSMPNKNTQSPDGGWGFLMKSNRKENTMSYHYISRTQARDEHNQNKWLKIAVAILTIVTVFALAFAHRYHTQLRMNTYAIEHDCTWHYSGYIDEEPVCK